MYFELSGEETKEDGAVWRIRGAEKKTAENGKKKRTQLVEYSKKDEVLNINDNGCGLDAKFLDY